MRNFLLYRAEDETNVSGNGIVAEGVEFLNGQCILQWITEPGSIGIYNSLNELIAIHGHNGKTVPVWHTNTHILFDIKGFK